MKIGEFEQKITEFLQKDAEKLNLIQKMDFEAKNQKNELKKLENLLSEAKIEF